MSAMDLLTQWKEIWQHWLSALSEGLCPVHHVPLDPVPAPRGRITGHCVPCRKYWGANLDTDVAGCWLDHHPATGAPRPDIPDWMTWAQDPIGRPA